MIVPFFYLKFLKFAVLNRQIEMLIRIVKMTFAADKVATFETMFDGVKEKIASFEGCLHLNLYQDQNNPQTFFTYSIWVDEEALEKYRHSELFKATWAKTKILFADKPEAWSLDQKF